MSQARDPARNIPNDSHMASQHSQLTITAKSHAFVYFHRPSRRGHVSPTRYNAGQRKPTQTTGSRGETRPPAFMASVSSKHNHILAQQHIGAVHPGGSSHDRRRGTETGAPPVHSSCACDQLPATTLRLHLPRLLSAAARASRRDPCTGAALNGHHRHHDA